VLKQKSFAGQSSALDTTQSSAVARKPTRGSIIRHLIALALLTGAAVEARADLVTYHMTGTVFATDVVNGAVAVGDHVSWTFQYDRSATPVAATSFTGWNYFQNAPTLFNIVDQTSGTHFYSPQDTTALQPSILTLGQQDPRTFSSAGLDSYTTWAMNNQGLYAHAGLMMIDLSGPLPTTNLANLALNSVPFDPRWQFFNYGTGTLDTIVSDFVNVKVDPLGDPVSPAPEPSSSTLLVLGGLGLAARRLCPAMKWSMRSWGKTRRKDDRSAGPG
jgi:hypothetical protein